MPKAALVYLVFRTMDACSSMPCVVRGAALSLSLSLSLSLFEPSRACLLCAKVAPSSNLQSECLNLFTVM